MNALWRKLKMYGFKTFLSYVVIESSYRFWTNIFLGSYSQDGEDLFMWKRLKKQRGFYVDVGANDPDRFSNTKLFYSRGWTGINIEPDVQLFQNLKKRRSKDRNVNVGIGENESTIPFYRFVPHTLSTFSSEEAEKYRVQGYQLVETKSVPVCRLSHLLDEYLPPEKKIDFMSIDTEGFDMHVLRSNDWQRFRPALICIESVTHTFNRKDNEKDDEHAEFLKSVGYVKIFDNGLNSIYEDRQ